MADQSKREGSAPTAGAALVFVGLLAAVVLREQPLISSRPVVPDAPRMERATAIEARLWQDPFGAVEEHRKLEHGKGRRCGEDQHAGIEHGVAGKGSTLVLLVMTNARAYPEDVEARLRARYAVVSAMAMSGYVPDREDGINFVRRAPPEVADDLPFEWYRPDRGPTSPVGRAFDDVLVLWVAESDRFAPRPLAALRELLSWVETQLSRDLHVHVLGPRSSSTLDAMLREASGTLPEVAFDQQAPPMIDVYSPWATADERELLQTQSITLDAAQLRDALLARRVRLVRTIAGDGDIARALRDELARNRIDIADEATDVAVVGEWDTLYGRSLPRTFARVSSEALWTDRPAAGSARGSTAARESPAEVPGYSDRVHKFSYLRGLDGTVVRRPSGTRPTNGLLDKPPSAEDRARRREALERPEGNGQLDYLRRLADRIDETNARLGASCGVWGRLTDRCRRIRAIGVLGSDVYDKLLVLQALRPRFPDVVFFTTDLDAVLLHPSETEWTRNVVIASAYGLSLPESEQAEVPPFRDGYQTSVYRATQMALRDDLAADPQTTGSVFHEIRRGPVRLFEVSRVGAADLSIGPPPDVAGGRPARYDVAARRLGALVPGAMLWLALGVIGLALASPLVARRDVQHAEVRARDLLIVLIVLLAIPWAAIALSVAAGESGEPFSVSNGVSAWPTIVIRTYIIVLSLYLSFRLVQRLRENALDIEQRFALTAPAKRTHTKVLRDLGAALKEGRWPDSLRISRWGAADHAPTSLQDRWREYQDREEITVRLLRVGASTIAFAAVGSLLLAIFGAPRAPMRGDLAYWAERATLVLGMGSVLVLNYLVVDATWICARFVELVGAIRDDAVIGDGGPASLGGSMGGTPGAADLRRLQLIERRTQVVGRFVYYPFWMLCLLLVARSRFFDDWNLPPSQIVLLALLGAYVVVCALILNRAAERARRGALDRLGEEWWRRAGDAGTNAPQVRAQVESSIDRIRSLSGGAFAPWTQHPIVGALLVPSGGVGVLALLDAWYAFR